MSYDPRFRRTKILATLGPASVGVLEALLAAGVDVVRINASHGKREEWAEWIAAVRDTAARAGRHIGVLVDLQGPRIRVGTLETPRTLEEGGPVVFAPEGEVTGDEIPTTYDALASDVTPGARILLDDGLLAVEVTDVQGPRVRGVVRHGGVLKSHKGINLPGVQVSAPALTDSDRADLAAALEQGADFVGISFVRRAEDVTQVRALVPPHVALIAKIEKAAALRDLARIVDAADALMVARGDLGVELPFEEVPLTQKRVIEEANRRSKPVITATQMLESMVRNPRPTRAEASDVANAILDGTDAVMLSAETAVGEYPVRAVEAMVRITHEIERSTLRDARQRRRQLDAMLEGVSGLVEDAIGVGTTVAAELLEVPLIVCFTKSGFTARKIASFRPAIPIIGLSTEAQTCRNLSLVWGVKPQLADRVPTYEAMLDVAREQLLGAGLVHSGDRIVVTAGVPFDVPGTTNLLKVETI